MPIYEYRCERCEAEFEVSQRITEDPLTTHEGCGGPVKRLISRTSFNLKGSGWYSDHYGLQTKNGEAGGSEASGGEKKAFASATSDKADKASSGEKKETKAAPAKKPASADKAKAGGGASTKD